MANLCLEPSLRPCYVTRYEADPKKPWHVEKTGTVNALFHCWEQHSYIVPPSMMTGGHNGGVVSGILGIVEFANGSIAQVKPEDIVFIDNKHEEYCWFVEDESRSHDNTCVCCGDIIPEGRQVCPRCENNVKGDI